MFQRQTSIVLPKWLTQGSMECLVKTELNLPDLTNASVHSLRSLGQLYGRISRCSKAAAINLPSMRGVMCKGVEMKCPVDGDVLSPDKAEDHTGYGCESCKGSWLPKSYIDSIKYTKEFDPQKFFSTLKSSEHDASNSKCPVNCGVLSSITDLNGISY